MNRKRFLMLSGGIALLGAVLFLGGEAAASEGTGDWRPTYDLVMKWVNFFILFFILFKYGRRPLKNFLSDQKTDLEQEIHRLEKEKEAVAQNANQAMKTLEESAATLVELKARILKEGEQERDRLVQEARDQAQVMLEGSRLKIENQLRRAKRAVIGGLVDSAVSLALEKLPEKITPEDHHRWIDRFITKIPAR